MTAADRASSSVKAPFGGVRILDVTTLLSGPLATSMLADQGADVVKVERPGAGDLTRSIGTQRNGMTAMFLLANRGKRSIVIDIRTDAGLAVFRRLAGRVDVVVQNFRPGVADKMGIGYESLRVSNPELIYLSIAGFGFDGPLASMKVFDNLIQATSGIAAQQADDDGTPRFVQNLICDKLTGVVAAQALSAALYARAQGTGGQHIELSMLDTAVSFLWSDAGTAQTFRGDGAVGVVSGKGNGLTRHRDGWTTVAAVSDEEFRALCVAYGRPDIADDPTMRTVAQRLSDPVRYRRMREQIDETASTLSTDEALRRLHSAGVPAARAVPLAEVPEHPQVLANETFATTRHPVAGDLIEPRPPVRFGQTRGQPAAPAPAMGAHTDEVLAEAGYSPEDIEELREKQVVA